MSKRIMILAGGTGGHVFPALAVAEALREQGHEIYWMGTQRGLEARVVPEHGIPIDWLAVTGWRGKSITARLKAPFMLLLAALQAAKILHHRKPDVVLGMGGFVAGPGGVMAWLLRIPLVIHEQNRIPGTTNRHLVRFAAAVLQAFPDAFPDSVKARWCGNPLRVVFSQPESMTNELEHKILRLLVVGGSLGAQVLNETVPQAVVGMLPEQIEIRHQSGNVMQNETQQLYQNLGVEAQVTAFIDDMAAAYRWADVVVCRAGAMTISELCAVGVAAVLVPYPYAIDDHQTHNAAWLADAGAALLLPQPQLSPESLTQLLRQLMNDEKRQTMSQAARQMARLDATDRVADICLEMAS